MFTALRILLYYRIFINSINGRRLLQNLTDQHPESLHDVTQLFAGVDVVTLPGEDKASMCCCKKSSKRGFCMVVEWTKSKPYCKHPLSASYCKHSNTGRSPDNRRCLVDEAANPQLMGMLSEGLADPLHHPKVVIEAYPVHLPIFMEEAQGSLRVYLMRHGQSKWNVMTEHVSGEFIQDWLLSRLKDAQLTPKGLDEAMSSQEFFRKRFQGVDPKSVQLAGSLLSRAYDTLVLATHNLWSSWQDEDYVIDQVPAFMEFGGQDVRRHSGLLDSSPVRWDESALPEGEVLSERFPEAAFRKHYESDPQGGEGWLTDDPWQVQVNYPRYSKGKSCSQNSEQLDSAIAYMQDVALSGKKHLVIGSHSNLIRCLMKRIAKRGLFKDVEVGSRFVGAVWQDEDGGTYNVYQDRIANAAVLTFDLQVANLAAAPVFRHLGIQSPSRGYPYLGELLVKVMRGRDLVNKDEQDHSDPYARISFGGGDLKSDTIKDSLNPTWNFTAAFKVASPMQVVRLSIWDEDTTGREFMGDVTIPIHEVIEKKEARTTVQLQHVDRGEVELEIVFNAVEWPDF
jgi:broad specificity phosphatase PhoE